MEKNPVSNVVKWIVLVAVLVYTSFSTAQLVTLVSGNLEGGVLVLRQIVAIALTDGGVILWHALSNRYPAENQRNIAAFMQWTCFSILGAFFVLSAVFSIIEPSQPFLVAEGVTMSVADAVGYGVLAAMGAIVLGTPAAFFAIENQSPEHRMKVESTKARQLLNDNLVKDYKTGQRAIMDVLSSNGAVENLKAQILAMGYTDAEAAILGDIAKRGIENSKPGTVLSTTIPAEVANKYQQVTAEVPNLTGGDFLSRPRRKVGAKQPPNA